MLLGRFRPNVSGAVTIRIVDTDDSASSTVLDSFSVDEIWIRIVP
jgi:hypothetical protein